MIGDEGDQVIRVDKGGFESSDFRSMLADLRKEVEKNVSGVLQKTAIPSYSSFIDSSVADLRRRQQEQSSN